MTVLALSVQGPFLLPFEIFLSIILSHFSQSSTWSCSDISLSMLNFLHLLSFCLAVESSPLYSSALKKTVKTYIAY